MSRVNKITDPKLVAAFRAAMAWVDAHPKRPPAPKKSKRGRAERAARKP